MQIIAGLVSLLKRTTSEREVPAEESASGSEQSGQHSELMHGAAADAKGRNKRMRLRDPPAAGAGALAGDFNLQVNSLFASTGSLSTEPQFVLPDGGEATDDSSSHELSSSSYAPSRNEATTSSDAELENVLPQQGSGSTCGGTSQLACLNTELGACSGSSSSSLDAFMQRLLSPMVAAALVALEMGRLHPLSPGTLSSTVAGLLVMSRRAQLSEDELAEEAPLLTLLWLLESVASQFREELGLVLRSYLAPLHHASRSRFYALKRRMLGLQVQLLERCSWRVVLREDGEELLAAQRELEASPAFHSTCATIAQWAEDGRVPPQVGGLGRSKAGATRGDLAQRVLGPHNQ